MNIKEYTYKSYQYIFLPRKLVYSNQMKKYDLESFEHTFFSSWSKKSHLNAEIVIPNLQTFEYTQLMK